MLSCSLFSGDGLYPRGSWNSPMLEVSFFLDQGAGFVRSRLGMYQVIRQLDQWSIDRLLVNELKLNVAFSLQHKCRSSCILWNMFVAAFADMLINMLIAVLANMLSWQYHKATGIYIDHLGKHIGHFDKHISIIILTFSAIYTNINFDYFVEIIYYIS